MLGIAYKKDISDVRESPALDIMRLLLEWGAQVIYNDPHIPKLRWDSGYIESAELTEELLQSVNIVILLANHSAYDYDWLAQHAPLIYDARNAFDGIDAPEGKIATLGVK